MRRLALILLSVCFLISCKSTTGIEEDEQEIKQGFEQVAFIPLEIGNYWVYDDSDTTFIRKDTTINNEILYKQVNPEFDSDGKLLYSTDYFYTYRDSGLVRYRLSNSELTDEMYFRFPNESGGFDDTFYEQKGLSNDRFSWFTLIKSVDSTITTPAGRFDCFVYHTTREDSENNNQVDIREEVYFAKDVGIVRRRVQAGNFPTNTFDLLKAKIGNNPESP